MNQTRAHAELVAMARHNLAHAAAGTIEQTEAVGQVPASDYLDPARFVEAGLSSAVCARVGPLDAPVWAGHLIHLCRDTAYGCEMRSRFWLGDFEPDIAPAAADRQKLIPDQVGWGLLKHCNEEMGFLAGFLPEYYRRESG